MSQDFPKTFKIRKEQIQALYVIGLMACLLILYSCFFAPKNVKVSLLIFLVAMLVLVLQRWRTSNFMLSLDETGIWETKAGKEKTFTAWENIIDYERSKWHGNVVLLDKNKQSCMTVHQSLDNANELFDVILSKSRILQHIDTTQTAFARPHPRFFYMGAGMATCLLIIFIVWNKSRSCTNNCSEMIDIILITLVLLVFFGMIFLGYYSTIYRLDIHDDYLELTSPYQKKQIAFSAIEAIEMHNHLNICLKTTTHKAPVQLGALGGDAIALYCCLKHHNNNTY